MENTKCCITCKEEKLISDFDKKGKYFYNTCKKCNKNRFKERNRKSYLKNREIKCEKQRDKYNKSKEYYKNYNVKNREKLREYCNKNIKILHDNYVKNRIFRQSKSELSAKEIPQELIKLKRASLELKRILKNKNNDNN